MLTMNTRNKTENELPDVLEILLDLESAVERLEASVGRLEAAVGRTERRSHATDTTVKRIEARTTRTESRLCQFMQDQGSEIYMPNPEDV